MQHKNNEGYLPSHIACSSRIISEDIFIKLIETYPEAASIKCNNESGDFALHLTCQCIRSEKVIRTLIDVNQMAFQESNKDGDYPIYCAYQSYNGIFTLNGIHRGQSYENFQMLLNADPLALQRRNINGDSVLHLACLYKTCPLKYMKHHATSGVINVRNNNGQSPLQMAFHKKYIKGVVETSWH